MRTKWRGRLSLILVLAFAIVLAIPAVALADTLINNVQAGNNDTFNEGGSTTINYRINDQNNDGQSGCNAADSSSATLTINVPSNVTANKSSLTYTACKVDQSVTFSSNKAGDYPINVTISDSGVGTYTNSANFTLHVKDVTAPGAPVIDSPANNSFDNDGNITFSGTAEANSTVTLFEGTTSKGTTQADASGNWSKALTGVAAGSHTYTAKATDAAGNTSVASNSRTVIVDTTAPDTTITSGPASGSSVNSASASFGFSSSETGSTFQCSLDNAAYATCTSPQNYTNLSEGSHTFQVKATDAAGNTDATPASRTWTVDTTPPQLSLPQDKVVEATGSNGAVVNYTATATDDTDGSVPVDCSPASGSTFSMGDTTVNCSATDSAGNTANGSFKVTVQDTTAPQLNLPQDKVVEATSDQGAVVNYDASATDSVDGSVPVDCQPASGSTFPMGDTTVNCSATDSAGNTANGSFKVTVNSSTQDTTPPQLSLPQDKVVEATGSNGAVVNYTATATDDTDGSVPVDCSPASGSTFSMGDTTVNCSATDSAGNTANGSFKVTVQDTTAPNISNIPADITTQSTGPDGAVVNYTSPTANDSVDGSVPVNCSPASGSTFPVGTTTVNCSATDSAGNTANGSFKVTVQDTTAPETTITSGPSNGSTVNSKTVTFAFSSSEAGSTFQCSLDSSNAFAACTGPNNTQSYSNLADGKHTFRVKATDAAGNTDATAAVRAWTVDTSVAACTITGTTSADTITGTSGDDVICGGGGNDTIKGVGGNDILRGEAGADKLFGGVGDDTLDGGTGTSSDTADYSASLTAITASLLNGTATGEGTDTLVNIETLKGSAKDDTLTGSNIINTITGAGGNDAINGLDGADKLTGSGGNDTMHGDTGNDSVVGSGGADNLFGDDGDDTVNSQDGVNGNDSLDGGPGTDTKITDTTEKSIINFP